MIKRFRAINLLLNLLVKKNVGEATDLAVTVVIVEAGTKEEGKFVHIQFIFFEFLLIIKLRI
jgi:hypothetical protein